MCCVEHNIPSNAKMKMKRNSRSRSERMDDMALVKATTRLRREDQYLEYFSEGEGCGYHSTMMMMMIDCLTL